VIVAFTYTNDKGESTQERAVVTDLLNMSAGVVCVYHPDNDSWEPVYMVKQRDNSFAIRAALPSCFKLNDESLEALKNVIMIRHDESGEAT
jgi:hypothetical protein